MRLVLFGQLRMLGVVLIDPVLNLVSVVLDQPLDWPGSGISQSADSVALNLLSELPQHVDLSVLGFSNLHSFEGVSQPSSSLPTWSALPTTLMLVEFAQPQDGLDHISGFIHNYNCRSAQSTLELPQGVEVHEHIITEILWQQSNR